MGAPDGRGPQIAQQPEIVLIGAQLATDGSQVDGHGQPVTVISISTASGLGRISVPLTDAGVDEFIGRLQAIKSEHVAAALAVPSNAMASLIDANGRALKRPL